MAKIIEVRKLKFPCESCREPAAYQVTTLVHHDKFGAMQEIHHYCREHLLNDALDMLLSMKP